MFRTICPGTLAARLRLLLFGSAMLPLLLSTRPLEAQDVVEVQPPLENPRHAPAPVPVQEASTHDQTPPAQAAPSEDPGQLTRLRFGFSFLIAGVVGENRGFGIGLALRLGIQFNDIFALYWNPSFAAALLWERSELGGYVSTGQALMADFTLADFIQLGVGPAVDIGYFGICAVDTTTTTATDVVDCNGKKGPFPALAARIAFLFGGRSGSRRRAFALSVESHTTFLRPEVLSAIMVGLGFELY